MRPVGFPAASINANSSMMNNPRDANFRVPDMMMIIEQDQRISYGYVWARDDTGGSGLTLHGHIAWHGFVSTANLAHPPPDVSR